MRGSGLLWMIPVVDSIPVWIDHRVMVTLFSAEKTLTKDTVPVDVDAVLFWLVWDAKKAALKVEEYRVDIPWGPNRLMGGDRANGSGRHPGRKGQDGSGITINHR